MREFGENGDGLPLLMMWRCSGRKPCSGSERPYWSFGMPRTKHTESHELVMLRFPSIVKYSNVLLSALGLAV